MTRELQCKATTVAGTRCAAPANVVDPNTKLCPAHAPGGREMLRQAGKKGGEAMARRFKGKALNEDELPPLNSPEVAEIWLERIARAVVTGGLPHNDARAATSALQQWLKAHEVGKLADRLETIKEQLEKLKVVR